MSFSRWGQKYKNVTSTNSGVYEPLIPGDSEDPDVNLEPRESEHDSLNNSTAFDFPNLDRTTVYDEDNPLTQDAEENYEAPTVRTRAGQIRINSLMHVTDEHDMEAGGRLPLTHRASPATRTQNEDAAYASRAWNMSANAIQTGWKKIKNQTHSTVFNLKLYSMYLLKVIEFNTPYIYTTMLTIATGIVIMYIGEEIRLLSFFAHGADDLSDNNNVAASVKHYANNALDSHLLSAESHENPGADYSTWNARAEARNNQYNEDWDNATFAGISPPVMLGSTIALLSIFFRALEVKYPRWHSTSDAQAQNRQNSINIFCATLCASALLFAAFVEVSRKSFYNDMYDDEMDYFEENGIPNPSPEQKTTIREISSTYADNEVSMRAYDTLYHKPSLFWGLSIVFGVFSIYGAVMYFGPSADGNQEIRNLTSSFKARRYQHDLTSEQHDKLVNLAQQLQKLLAKQNNLRQQRSHSAEATRNSSQFELSPVITRTDSGSGSDQALLEEGAQLTNQIAAVDQQIHALLQPSQKNLSAFSMANIIQPISRASSSIHSFSSQVSGQPGNPINPGRPLSLDSTADTFPALAVEIPLALRPVKADGNCLFDAFAPTNEQGDPTSAQVLREHVADCLENNQTYDEQGNPTIPYSERENEDNAAYCERMRKDGEWGGELELQAIANLTGRELVVFSMGNPPLRFRPKTEQGDEVLNTPRAYAVWNGTHYDAFVIESGHSETDAETAINNIINRTDGDPRNVLTYNHSTSEFLALTPEQAAFQRKINTMESLGDELDTLCRQLSPESSNRLTNENRNIDNEYQQSTRPELIIDRLIEQKKVLVNAAKAEIADNKKELARLQGAVAQELGALDENNPGKQALQTKFNALCSDQESSPASKIAVLLLLRVNIARLKADPDQSGNLPDNAKLSSLIENEALKELVQHIENYNKPQQFNNTPGNRNTASFVAAQQNKNVTKLTPQIQFTAYLNTLHNVLNNVASAYRELKQQDVFFAYNAVMGFMAGEENAPTLSGDAATYHDAIKNTLTDSPLFRMSVEQINIIENLTLSRAHRPAPEVPSAPTSAASFFSYPPTRPITPPEPDNENNDAGQAPWQTKNDY